MKTLACYFDAPMQSYGVESRFDRRTTLPFPSRSVVSGVLCAALGVDRSDRDFLARFARLNVDVLELARRVSEKAKESLRVSNLLDYHTIGGGFDDKVDGEKRFISRTASGKPSGVVQSYREYLTDARFGALIYGDDALIERFDVALRNPRWGVWFGRKCCIPASPIAQGVFERRADAVGKLCALAGCDQPRRLIRDAKTYDEEDALSYMDVPITFERSRRGTGEEFGLRRIVVRDWNDCTDEEKGLL